MHRNTANQYGPSGLTLGSKRNPVKVGGDCGALASFGEGDEHSCALPKRHVELGQLHENVTGTRRWSLEYGDDGQPLAGMVKPGTEVQSQACPLCGEVECPHCKDEPPRPTGIQHRCCDRRERAFGGQL